MQFQNLGIAPDILRALKDAGYEQPSPIQEGAIPPALEGRDILGLAQTGTGKTCAFAVPILQYLMGSKNKGARPPRALIVTPTRELAIQIGDSFRSYGKYLLHIKHTVIYGGVGQQPQVNALRRGLDVLIATPGRLLDLHGQGELDLTAIDLFVLDEADRMLDMGFWPDVKRILAQLPHEKQTMLFSATMPDEVKDVVDRLLKNPANIQVAPVSSPVEVIVQRVYHVDKGNKSRLLAHLMKTEHIARALIFSRTKHGANKVAADLEKAGIPAAAIHGNKSQTARVAALEGFKKGEVRALVATDIAARGIDIDSLTHVFNYNLPEVPETYIHRIGRTGRAGKDGTAISFATFDELSYLKGIEKLMGRKVELVSDHPYPMQDTTTSTIVTRNGRRVNAEDEEARQAARERKFARQQAQGARKPKAPAEKAAEKSAKPAGKPVAKPAPKLPELPVKGADIPAEISGERRRNRRRKGGHSEAHAVQPAAPTNNKAAQKAVIEQALPKEESGGRSRLSNNFTSTRPSALEGDRIMDATARLLASKSHAKKVGQKSDRPQEQNRRKPEAGGQNQPRGSQQGKAQSSSGNQGGKGRNQPKQHWETRTQQGTQSGRRGSRPPRPEPTPPKEHSEDFKPFYINFDD